MKCKFCKKEEWYDVSCKKHLIDKIHWEIKYNNHEGVHTRLNCSCGRESFRGSTRACNKCLREELNELCRRGKAV